MCRDFVGSLVLVKGHLNAEQYEQILSKHMLPMAKERMMQEWYFQQDNDPKHKSARMMGPVRKLPNGQRIRLPGWFSLNGIRLLKTPPYSPDINPIEHLWAQLKYRLMGIHFKNKEELWETLKSEWESIPLDKIIDLVDSMPRRLRAIRLAKGGPTKY